MHLSHVDSLVKSCRTCSCALGSSDCNAVVLVCVVRKGVDGEYSKGKKASSTTETAESPRAAC